MALTDQQKNDVNLNVPVWVNLLLKSGVPVNIVPLLIAQVIYESGWFSSRAYKLNKNPSGITWNNNYLQRPGTSIGIKRPTREGGNYVNFDSYETAVKDYLRILNRSGRQGRPIDATDPETFINRLKANNYFAGSITDYKRGINSILKNVNTVLDLEAVIKKKGINTAAINPIFILVIIGAVIGTVFKK